MRTQLIEQREDLKTSLTLEHELEMDQLKEEFINTSEGQLTQTRLVSPTSHPLS